MRMRHTADLQQIEQALEEGLSAEGVLVLLYFVEDARAIGDTLEDSVKVFYVKHCD
jgi:hypothetical protein